MPLTARQSIEMFHLVFLRALAAKGEEKSLVALKGGCNLRFYMGSVRYSEDIDFDVVVIGKETLKNKVDRLLRSPLVTAPLRTRGIDVVDVSAPKQTDTTQRWKVGLRTEGLGVAIRTKLEFSRRDTIDGVAFESTGRDLLRAYGLTPILATHYTTHAAIAQKIHALAGRSEPQARDVFDLGHLLARSDAAGIRLSAAQKRWLPDAVERAMGITFDEYASKVVAFLDPTQAAIFQDRETWNAMQESVVAQLEQLR